MKKALMVLTAFFFLQHSYSQQRGDTLNLSNYATHATTVANSMGAGLGLNTNQRDSVIAIYSDYFVSMLNLKASNPGTIQLNAMLNLYRSVKYSRLKNVLSPQQFAGFSQHRVDSIQRLRNKKNLSHMPQK